MSDKITDAGDMPDDLQRRKLLRNATLAVGGASLVVAAYPFVASLQPSARALAAGAPVDEEFAQLAPGGMKVVAWRGKPVWIMRRTPAMVQALKAPNSVLADPASERSLQPASCANATRSIRPDVFVAIGICTHLGCSPTLEMNSTLMQTRLHESGGFFCPCHGSIYDLAGRVIKGVPAPTNLEIPDYRFVAPNKLVIG